MRRRAAIHTSHIARVLAEYFQRLLNVFIRRFDYGENRQDERVVDCGLAALQFLRLRPLRALKLEPLSQFTFGGHRRPPFGDLFGTAPQTRAKDLRGFWPQATMNQRNSTKSIRRSPVSTLATQLWGTLRRAASSRWERPASSRADRSSRHSAAYSAVCVDFRIAPIIGACYTAPKIGAFSC